MNVQFSRPMAAVGLGVLLLVVSPGQLLAEPALYWTDTKANTLQRANSDGTGIEALTAATLSFGIAVDRNAGKVYWTDIGNFTTQPALGDEVIRRANLDGSAVETLVTSADGLRHPVDIALDVEHGKMYWTDAGTMRIYRADLNGTNVELVLDMLTLRGPDYGINGQFEFAQVWGLALDVPNNALYWTDYFAKDIHRADLDGANIVQLVTVPDGTPRGIDLDSAGGKMYWVNGDFGSAVMRANLDGSQAEILVDKDLGTRLKAPFEIVVDGATGLMYWTDRDTGLIQRANLDGSNVVTLMSFTFEKKPGRFEPLSPTAITLTLPDGPPAPPPARADLSLTMTATADPVTLGEPLTYHLTVTNNGPDAASGVVLQDTLPAEVTLLAGPPVDCVDISGIINCDLGTLASGASATVTLMSTTMIEGTAINTATVTSIAPDPNSTNNSASQTTSIVDAAGGSATTDLTGSIEKLRVKTNNGSAELEFEVDVVNSGTDAVNEIFVVEASLIAGGISSVLERWTIGGLAAGQTSTVKWKNTVTGSVAGATLEIRVDADGQIAEVDERNNVFSQTIP